MQSRVGKTAFYGYNKCNQLISYESESAKASYSYNADGLRESKTVDGKTTQYYYNGAFVVNESENGSLSATNLLGVNSIIGRKAGADTAYFAKNGHGDVTKAVGLDGSVKASYETDVWGEVTGETGSFDNPVRYAGEYFDSESGNLYLRARYYDPTGGRFLSEDPIKDGLNWYAYCGGNPVNFVDPLGLAAGDFLVNGNVIGNTSKWKTGVYGNGRDFVKAMGGNVTQQDNSSVYNFSIGIVSFSIDTGTIGSYGKVQASNGSTIQYTIIEDPANPGFAKTLINLQDAANASTKSGYSATYAWDLGTEGGTWQISSNVDNRSICYIPMNKVKTSYNSIPSNILDNLPSNPDGLDILAAIIVGSIAGNRENADFQNELNSGKTFMRFDRYSNWLIDYSSKSFSGSNDSYLYVDAGQIGYFAYGVYGI